VKPLLPTLSLMVTYQCNIECKHCGPYCSPRDRDWMSLDEIKDLIAQAAELGAFNVVFTGGEPTLLKDDLLEILRYTRDVAKIASTRMVTNGKWAVSYDRARELLERWRDAGLAELNVSCGEYHQEFVPIEHVANAYRAAVDVGYKTVLLVGEFLKPGAGRYSAEDYYAAVGRPLPPSELTSPYSEIAHGMSCGKAMAQGRGKELVPREGLDLVDEAQLPGICREVFSAITCHPNGNTTACCGVMTRAESLLNVGNWREQRLRTILEAAHRDVVLNWIRYVGLHDMKRWLREQNPTLAFEDRYVTICDLCADIVYNRGAQDTLVQLGQARAREVLAAKIATDAVDYEADAFVYR